MCEKALWASLELNQTPGFDYPGKILRKASPSHKITKKLFPSALGESRGLETSQASLKT